MRRLLGAALAGVLLLPAAVSCGGDPQDAYCAAVKDHQQELGEAVGAGGQDALLGALDVMRDLADRAPQDISDEWSTLVDSLEALRDALDDAGVDASSYDRDQPPAGLSAEDKDRIDAAATDVGSARTAAALDGLEQQARDVCQTQLYL